SPVSCTTTGTIRGKTGMWQTRGRTKRSLPGWRDCSQPAGKVTPRQSETSQGVIVMFNRFTVLALLLLAGRAAAGDDFALRHGDTVVFLGDSIPAARIYGKIIEDYTLLRFPDRTIRLYNAGRGGDTAAGGLARLEQDVFSCKPTVLIVAYGVNDIGWGVKA